MKMKTTILLLLLLISSPAFAGDWSDGDTAREVTWQAINVLDWGQTLDIADKCRTTNVIELNPLLPECPTFKQVNRHFVIGAALHFGASYVLPKKYRVGFQWVTIGFGAAIVHSNYKLGLKIEF